jgi:hypothetical protein
MAKENLVFVIVPKGVPKIGSGDFLKLLEATVQDAQNRAAQSMSVSFDSKTLLEKIKSLILEKAKALPFTVRIVMIEGVEKGESIDRVAHQIAGIDPQKEQYSTISLPYFISAIDPTNATNAQNQTVKIVTVSVAIVSLAALGYYLYKRFKT